MKSARCPVDVIAEARRLAALMQGEDLPLAYDPGDLGWDQNLLRIAREYTNYGALLSQLEDWRVAELEASGADCGLRSPPPDGAPGQTCPNCSDRWVAQHELSEAARRTAEWLYQRWLARKLVADRRARE